MKIERRRFASPTAFAVLVMLGGVAHADPISEQAKPADSVVESLGVGDRFDYLWKEGHLPQAFKAIQSLGVRYLRVGVSPESGDAHAFVQAMTQMLADASSPSVRIRVSAQVYWNPWADTAGYIDDWLDAGSIIALEGVNESWLDPIDSGWSSAEELQEAIWTNYSDSGLEIYGWTLGGTAGNYLNHVDAGAGNEARACHYLNFHPYDWYTTPGPAPGDAPTKMIGLWQNAETPSATDWGEDAGCIAAVHQMTGDPDASYVATEWGWSHDNQVHAVPLDVAAKFYARNIFEATNGNLHRSFLFSLTERGSGVKPDGGDPGLGNYSLANYDDGTLFANGQAVANIISIVQEPGQASFAASSLNYDIQIDSGMSYVDDHRIEDTEIHHTLLQKSDGTFYLVLWVDYDSQNGFDGGTDALDGGISPWRQYATITLPDGAADVQAYLPVTNGNAPYYDFKQVAPGGSIRLDDTTVPLPDHPLILAIFPATTAEAGADAGPSGDAGEVDATARGDAAAGRTGSESNHPNPNPSSTSGCACRSAEPSSEQWPWTAGLVVLALLVRRRRR